MKTPICTIGGAALLAAIGAASPAHADICDESGPKNQWGKATVAGTYFVQNNRWNDKIPGTQCIKVIEQGPGFAITKQTGTAPRAEDGPVSYPSIYIGCHYAAVKSQCSPGTNLPIQVRKIKKAETGVTLKYADGAVFDASYDIWLDPKPITTGVNKQEIMIWLNKQGSIKGTAIQPVGQVVDESVKLAGQTWAVWWGSNGKNDVISYVAPAAVSNMKFDVLEFVTDVVKRGKITDDFYLTSIQAGFEPWQDGDGLAIESFRAGVDAAN